MNPGHQPQRFEVFNYLPNQRAFTIQDSNHIFKLDRYGGWFDQHGNYYNQNAQPAQPPSSSDSYSHEDQLSRQPSSQQDEYQKQFGKPGYTSDDEDHHQAQFVSSIAQNILLLQQYPNNTYIRIYFSNLGFHSRLSQVLSAYRQITKGVLNIVLDKSSGKRGTGYFILADIQSSLALVNLQGKKILERPLYFEVQKFQDNLLSPIIQQQLHHKEQSKKYLLKQPIKKNNQQKPQQILQIPWKWYKFQKQIFPKKSNFKEWMMSQGFIFQVDFKHVEKLQNDVQKKYAKIQMKESTYKSVNGLQFEGKKVQFFPLQI